MRSQSLCVLLKSLICCLIISVVRASENKPWIPINVINLDRDTARWDRAVAELCDKGGVTKEQIHRFSAVYGKHLSQKELEENTTSMARKFATLGMVGCFLSHRNLARKISQEDFDCQIVLEDDVIVTPNFLDQVETCIQELQNCTETKDKWDVLMLGAFSCIHPKKLYGLYLVQGMLAGTLRRPRFITDHVHVPLRPLGTHAYVVSKRGATKMAKRLTKANYHVDIVAWGDRNLNLYLCHPLICYRDYESSDNTIGSAAHSLEKLLLPNFQMDSYTKVKTQWVLSEPLFRIGPLVVSIGRYIFFGLVGIVISLLLPGTAITLPLHLLTLTGFTFVFMRLMMRLPVPHSDNTEIP